MISFLMRDQMLILGHRDGCHRRPTPQVPALESRWSVTNFFLQYVQTKSALFLPAKADISTRVDKQSINGHLFFVKNHPSPSCYS
jgi:hypothetical protein